MNVKGRALLLSTGGLIVILLVIVVINQVLARQFTPDLTNLDPNDPLGDTNILLLSAVGGLALICQVLLYLGGGASYAILARREGPIDTQDGVVGGALSAGAASIVVGIVSAGLSLLFSSDALSQVGADLPAEFASVALLGGTVGAIIGICCWFIVAGFLGAIGGAVAASVANR